VIRLQGFATGDDEPYIYMEFTSNSNPTGPDKIIRWENSSSTSVLNLSAVGGFPSGTVVQLGIMEHNKGKSATAIRGLDFEAVPEPAAFVLTGIPLLALGMFLKRRAAKRHN
jgi:hypothetical protein